MDQKIPAPDPEGEPTAHLNPVHRGTRDGFTDPEIESDSRDRPRMACACGEDGAVDDSPRQLRKQCRGASNPMSSLVPDCSGNEPTSVRTMCAEGTLPIGDEPDVGTDLPQQWDFLPRTCPTQPAPLDSSWQHPSPRLRERLIPHQRHPLRCRIRARMRRFLRPSFRRPFPVFFTPMLRLPLLLRV
jgi:hypothetical protein